MLQQHWNEVYASNNLAWGHSPSQFLQDVVNVLPEGSRVVDLGCGNGRNLDYMAEQGFDVVGYEYSDVAIKQSQSNLIHKKDLVNEPWDFGEFDIVLDFGFYHFYPQDKQQEYFEKLDSILVKGGFYINESARLVNKPWNAKNNPLEYVPPQLQSQDFDVFNSYLNIMFQQAVLPPHGDWKEYSCWQAVYKK